MEIEFPQISAVVQIEEPKWGDDTVLVFNNYEGETPVEIIDNRG